MTLPSASLARQSLSSAILVSTPIHHFYPEWGRKGLATYHITFNTMLWWTKAQSNCRVLRNATVDGRVIVCCTDKEFWEVIAAKIDQCIGGSHPFWQQSLLRTLCSYCRYSSTSDCLVLVFYNLIGALDSPCHAMVGVWHVTRPFPPFPECKQRMDRETRLV